MIRSVNQVVTGIATQDGAGVKLTRVISRPNVYAFDPFLMLDAFDSINPLDYIKGFPWHPHRGIETITYLINGQINHGDSLGNQGIIADGCCQWMTAGSGIMHQEMPQATPRMLGVQLWLNLPRQNKMTHPQYNDLTTNLIPQVQIEGANVRIISGRYLNHTASMQGNYVKMLFLDVDLKPSVTWQLATPNDETLFIYILQGDGYLNEVDSYSSKRAILFNPGDLFKIKAGLHGLHFLLFMAKPIKEPVAWGGPIVMNTRQELEQAFNELDKQTFIKHR